MKSPQRARHSPQKGRHSPYRARQNENLGHNIQPRLQATPQSVSTSKVDSASFGFTPQEREMQKYRVDNDKVVGYYKKVMKDIRSTIKSEREQV